MGSVNNPFVKVLFEDNEGSQFECLLGIGDEGRGQLKSFLQASSAQHKFSPFTPAFFNEQVLIKKALSVAIYSRMTIDIHTHPADSKKIVASGFRKNHHISSPLDTCLRKTTKVTLQEMFSWGGGYLPPLPS